MKTDKSLVIRKQNSMQTLQIFMEKKSFQQVPSSRRTDKKYVQASRIWQIRKSEHEENLSKDKPAERGGWERKIKDKDSQNCQKERMTTDLRSDYMNISVITTAFLPLAHLLFFTRPKYPTSTPINTGIWDFQRCKGSSSISEAVNRLLSQNGIDCVVLHSSLRYHELKPIIWEQTKFSAGLTNQICSHELWETPQLGTRTHSWKQEQAHPLLAARGTRQALTAYTTTLQMVQNIQCLSQIRWASGWSSSPPLQ